MEDENLFAKLFDSTERTIGSLFDDYERPSPEQGISREQLIKAGLGLNLDRVVQHGRNMSVWSDGSGLPSEINQELSVARNEAFHGGGITGYGHARGQASRAIAGLDRGSSTRQNMLNQIRGSSREKLQKVNELLGQNNNQFLRTLGQ